MRRPVWLDIVDEVGWDKGFAGSGKARDDGGFLRSKSLVGDPLLVRDRGTWHLFRSRSERLNP